VLQARAQRRLACVARFTPTRLLRPCPYPSAYPAPAHAPAHAPAPARRGNGESIDRGGGRDGGGHVVVLQVRLREEGRVGVEARHGVEFVPVVIAHKRCARLRLLG
jgi:hypothetical protein